MEVHLERNFTLIQLFDNIRRSEHRRRHHELSGYYLIVEYNKRELILNK
jgi:hypothetical protein